ncbi:hypothetical protein V6V47_03580 [Micromonospora sp. CPCC 205539]|uniref:hypothetical protein n=1 Tax=Micromonospora sp. CPCC 205539 TaxID=3122408 RepID=UPI002FEEA3C7
MARWIMQVLGLVAFGGLLGFIGVTLILNLFGVADEQARQMSKSWWNRAWGAPDRDPADIRQDPGFLIGNYIVGGGALLLGVAAVIGSIVLLVGGPSD